MDDPILVLTVPAIPRVPWAAHGTRWTAQGTFGMAHGTRGPSHASHWRPKPQPNPSSTLKAFLACRLMPSHACHGASHSYGTTHRRVGCHQVAPIGCLNGGLRLGDSLGHSWGVWERMGGAMRRLSVDGMCGTAHGTHVGHPRAILSSVGCLKRPMDCPTLLMSGPNPKPNPSSTLKLFRGRCSMQCFAFHGPSHSHGTTHGTRSMA